jgi:hypothetical protein
MERFGSTEGPTGAADGTPIFGRWPDALDAADGAGPRADARVTARTAAGPWSIRRWDGMVVLGAIGGSTAGLGVGAIAGWTSTSVSLAVLVGLDLGMLAGAGTSVLAARWFREG